MGCITFTVSHLYPWCKNVEYQGYSQFQSTSVYFHKLLYLPLSCWLTIIIRQQIDLHFWHHYNQVTQLVRLMVVPPYSTFIQLHPVAETFVDWIPVCKPLHRPGWTLETDDPGRKWPFATVIMPHSHVNWSAVPLLRFILSDLAMFS